MKILQKHKENVVSINSSMMFLKWLYLYRNCIVQVYCCNQVSSINQLKTSLDFNSLHRCTMITIEINLVFHSQNYHQATQFAYSSSNTGYTPLKKTLTRFEIISTIFVVRKTWHVNPIVFRRGITEQEFPDDSESPTLLPSTFTLSLRSLLSPLKKKKNPRRILPNPIFALQSNL